MLKKLSLAALVAMGSMSVASATDLSEAIKGVNLKGALRIRLYHESDGSYKDEHGKVHDYTTKWRTNAAFIFAVPVSDELKLVDRVSTETYIRSDASNAGGSGVNSFVQDNVLFAKYSKNGLTVLAGKIPLATPITDTDLFGPPTHGAGVLGTYKVNDNLTVAAAGMDAIVAFKVNEDFKKATGNNVYAAAAIYKSNVADVQAWFFQVDDVIDSDIVLSADIKALKDAGVKIHVDYAQAELDDSISDDTQTYFNINASFKKDALSAKLGYAVTGEDGGIVVLDGDSKLASVAATHQYTGIANTGDNNMIYAKLGYDVDEKTSVYVAYSGIDKVSHDKVTTKTTKTTTKVPVLDENGKKTKNYIETTTTETTSSTTTIKDGSATEIEIGAKYKYTKKFTLSAYYSMATKINNGDDNNEARVEAIYKF